MTVRSRYRTAPTRPTSPSFVRGQTAHLATEPNHRSHADRCSAPPGQPKVFNPLKVPKALQAQLPFKSKPKLEVRKSAKQAKANQGGYLKKRALVMEPDERQRHAVLQQIRQAAESLNQSGAACPSGPWGSRGGRRCV